MIDIDANEGDDEKDHDQKPRNAEFTNKRASHYNEFKVLQAMRAKMAAEEDDEDEDSDDDYDYKSPVKTPPKSAQVPVQVPNNPVDGNHSQQIK